MVYLWTWTRQGWLLGATFAEPVGSPGLMWSGPSPALLPLWKDRLVLHGGCLVFLSGGVDSFGLGWSRDGEGSGNSEAALLVFGGGSSIRDWGISGVLIRSSREAHPRARLRLPRWLGIEHGAHSCVSQGQPVALLFALRGLCHEHNRITRLSRGQWYVWRSFRQISHIRYVITVMNMMTTLAAPPMSLPV